MGLEFQIKLNTLMSCADPSTYQRAEFKRGLTIEFTFAQEYREGGKEVFGFVYGLESRDLDGTVDVARSRGSDAAFAVKVWCQVVCGLDF